MNAPQTSFESLAIPRKDLPQVVSKYRVYSNPQDYVVVDASTAIGALDASGLTNAYKITREDPMAYNLLDRAAWREIEDAAAARATGAPQAAQAAQVAPAVAEPSQPEAELPASPDEQGAV